MSKEALNVEDRKITNLQSIGETFNDFSVATAENVERQSRNNLFNDDDNRTDNHSHFIEQAFNKPYPTMEPKTHQRKK
jgi:hypothetical protein